MMSAAKVEKNTAPLVPGSVSGRRGVAGVSAVSAGAREHYVDGDAYDRRYGARLEDQAYYGRLAKQGDRVLEHGAGTGRMTLPLLASGASVTAVDVSEEMLSVLRVRLASATPEVRRRCRVKLADMRDFHSSGRYDWVIAGFHALCHIYAPQELARFLKNSYRHLRPGGKLVFDVPMPRIDLDQYDPIAQVRVTEIDGPRGPELLTLRVYQPQELAMHLSYAGFVQVKLTSDFTSQPVNQDTDVIVVTARRPSV